MKNKTRKWLSITLLFLSGMAVGTAGTGYFVRSHIKSFLAGGPPAMHSRIRRKIMRNMDLTDIQRERIRDIVNKTRPEIEKLSRDFGEDMMRISEEEVEMIKKVLTQGQQEILDERIKEFHSRMYHMMGKRGKGKWDGRKIPKNAPPRTGHRSSADENNR